MNLQAKISYVQEVLGDLIGLKLERLSRGKTLRQVMHAAIARGEEPKGYRPDFIADTSHELVQFLLQRCEKFNMEHVDDMASVADILDVLSTTKKLFENGV